MTKLIAIVACAGMAGAADVTSEYSPNVRVPDVTSEYSPNVRVPDVVQAQGANSALKTVTMDYRTGEMSDGSATGRAAGLVYDNTQNFSLGVRTQTLGNTVRDDLQIVGDGIIDEVTFSIFNGDVNTYAGGSVTIDFNVRVPNFTIGASLGSLTVDLAGLDLVSNGVALFTLTGLEGLGITLSSNADIWAGLTYNDAGGLADPNALGQALFDPPAVGTSNDFFLDETSPLFFGGSPVANFGWAITTVVPTPGAATLLGLAGLGLSRRRR
jgi:uncharacterized protein (TIGR03382 family)